MNPNSLAETSPIAAADALTNVTDYLTMLELKVLLENPASPLFKTYLDGIAKEKDEKFEFTNSGVHATSPS